MVRSKEATSASLRTAAPAWVRSALTVLFGLSVVNAGNYAVNIVLARYLTPAELAEAVFATTGLLVLSAGALALQTTTARGWAAAHARGDEAGAARVIQEARSLAVWAGLALLVAIAAGASQLEAQFQLTSTASLWWLAALAPLHLLQGLQRGILQGRDRMSRFTLTFQAEMVVRLAGSWLALHFGLGLQGVYAALFFSVVASLCAGDTQALLVRAQRPERTSSPTRLGPMLASAAVAQLSVIAFTQADILVAKARVAPALAGAFSTVVLTSRIVSFVVQALSSALLPAIVRRASLKQPTGGLLAAASGALLLVGAPLLLVSWLIPEPAIRILFGAQHTLAAPFLAPYVAATLLHALACLAIDYAFCLGVRALSYLSVTIAAIKLLVVLRFAEDLGSLVSLALATSALLFVCCAIGAALGQRVRRASLAPGSIHPERPSVLPGGA